MHSSFATSSSSSSFAESKTIDDKPYCLNLHLSLTCDCNVTSCSTSDRKRKILNDDNDSDQVKLCSWPPCFKKRRTMANVQVREAEVFNVAPIAFAVGNEVVPYVEFQDCGLIQRVEDLREWTIKKVLKKSDVDGSSRLLIGRNEVFRHIAPFFTKVPSEFCQDDQGIRVAVFDVDTRTENVLVMKKWKTKSFVLVNNWKKEFVNRRRLMVDDEVGLRWDRDASRLEFTVLRQSTARNKLHCINLQSTILSQDAVACKE